MPSGRNCSGTEGLKRAPAPARSLPDGGRVEIEIIVEIPQGSRNKYEMDHASGRIRLDRMLFTSTRYRLDYGFIPDTLAEDGDPLDAMVLLAEPTFPGCSISARPVGVSWMHDEHGPDAKILAAPARDPRYADIRDLSDVPEHLRGEIGQFFDIYEELEPGRGNDVRGWQGRAAEERNYRSRSRGTTKSVSRAPPGSRSRQAPGAARTATAPVGNFACIRCSASAAWASAYSRASVPARSGTPGS